MPPTIGITGRPILLLALVVLIPIQIVRAHKESQAAPPHLNSPFRITPEPAVGGSPTTDQCRS
jgi:hypothetical protein